MNISPGDDLSDVEEFFADRPVKAKARDLDFTSPEPAEAVMTLGNVALRVIPGPQHTPEQVARARAGERAFITAANARDDSAPLESDYDEDNAEHEAAVIKRLKWLRADREARARLAMGDVHEMVEGLNATREGDHVAPELADALGLIDPTAQAEAIEMLEDGLIQKGARNLLYSPSGVGKTPLIFTLAWWWAKGYQGLLHEDDIRDDETEPIRRRLACGPQRILYLDGEIGKAGWTWYRAKMVGPDGHEPLPFIVSCFPKGILGNLHTEVGASMALELIRVTQADVVIVDTMSSFVHADENGPTAYGEFDSHFLIPCMRAGVTVVVLDHTGKGPNATTPNGSEGKVRKFENSVLIAKDTRTQGTLVLRSGSKNRFGLLANGPVHVRRDGGYLADPREWVKPLTHTTWVPAPARGGRAAARDLTDLDDAARANNEAKWDATVEAFKTSGVPMTCNKVYRENWVSKIKKGNNAEYTALWREWAEEGRLVPAEKPKGASGPQSGYYWPDCLSSP